MQSLKVDGRREALLDLLGELPFEVPSNFSDYVRGDAEIGELIRIGRSLMKSRVRSRRFSNRSDPWRDMSSYRRRLWTGSHGQGRCPLRITRQGGRWAQCLIQFPKGIVR
jgi:hypothetical protein